MSKRNIYNLVVITFYFYGNNDIAPGVRTSAFPAVLAVSVAIRCASWCPNHAPDVETGESRRLRVSRRLYAAYVRSHTRHWDRRISRSSGVSKARHCLLWALYLDSRCCRASTLSVARRFVARWRFLVELSSSCFIHDRTCGEPTYVKLGAAYYITVCAAPDDARRYKYIYIYIYIYMYIYRFHWPCACA